MSATFARATNPKNDPREWRAVEGYVGDYEVSNLGEVRSLIGREPRILRPGRATSGYLTVALRGKSFTVHGLVMVTFSGPRASHRDRRRRAPTHLAARLNPVPFLTF